VTRHPNPRSAQEAPLVLVVDDYEDAREMYAESLRVSGYRVALARDGREAVAETDALLPDLVLMDLSLPGLDGWEATRQIKANPRTRHIPVVALTGHALSNAAEGARAAGCDAFVLKPCLPDDMLLEVQRVLARASREGVS
jgi:two-component system cell cycle response regulator DivK